MKAIRLICASALCLAYAAALWADAPKKNWTAPAQRIRAQALTPFSIDSEP